MSRPFRFGVVEAHAPSRTAWVTIARRVEELGYATLLIPDRMNVGSLAWEQASHRPSFNRWAFRLGAGAHASIILRKRFRS